MALRAEYATTLSSQYVLEPCPGILDLGTLFRTVQVLVPFIPVLGELCYLELCYPGIDYLLDSIQIIVVQYVIV